MKRFFFALFLLCCTLVQGRAQTQPNATKQGWLTLSDSAYQIRYPATWLLDQSEMYGSRFFLFSPLDSTGDTFREYLNLVMIELGKEDKFTLSEIASMRHQQIEYFTNVEFLQFKEEQHGRQHYYLCEYVCDQGQLRLHWKQYYWLENNFCYVLSFAAEDRAFANYAPLAEQIMATFSPKQ